MSESWEDVSVSSDRDIIDKMRRRGKCTAYTGDVPTRLCLEDADFEWVLVNTNLPYPPGTTLFACLHHHNTWLATSTMSNWNTIPIVSQPSAAKTCTCPMSQLLRSGCKCGGK